MSNFQLIVFLSEYLVFSVLNIVRESLREIHIERKVLFSHATLKFKLKNVY